MKSRIKTIIPVLMLIYVAIFAGTALSQTTAFTYQGKLNDGASAANANYDFEFRLYDGGGTQIGSTAVRNNVAVSSGVFTVDLDFGPGFPGADRFLEIAVRPAGSGGFTVLAPRQRVNTSPYAIKSISSDTANTATNATNAVNATTAANATNAATAVNFSGSLSGDVTGTQTASTVSRLQGRNLANTLPLAGQVIAYNGATSQWEPTTAAGGGTITGVTPGTGLAGGGVSGNVTLNIANGGVGTTQLADGSVTDPKIDTVSGGKVTGTVANAANAGNATTANSATTATSFTGNLVGNVTGTQGATVVSTVGGQSAANVANATVLANAATSANIANTLVRRNASGGFSAGFIVADTASINGTLDMNDFVIANIGSPGTDFTATGGLTLASNLTVNTAPGDGAVILPTGSISAVETLNEPGVASATSDSNVSLDGTVQTLLSRNITVPSAGFVLVIGTLQGNINHMSGASSANFGVSNTAASLPDNQDLFFGLSASVPSGVYNTPITVHGLFSVAAGLHTFYFLGIENFGSYTVSDMQLSVLFVPTGYGTVSPTFAEPVSGKSVAKPLVTAGKLPAEKALTPKAMPDANTPKQLKAEIDELKKIVCSLKPDAAACKETNK